MLLADLYRRDWHDFRRNRYDEDVNDIRGKIAAGIQRPYVDL